MTADPLIGPKLVSIGLVVGVVALFWTRILFVPSAALLIVGGVLWAKRRPELPSSEENEDLPTYTRRHPVQAFVLAPLLSASLAFGFSMLKYGDDHSAGRALLLSSAWGGGLGAYVLLGMLWNRFLRSPSSDDTEEG